MTKTEKNRQLPGRLPDANTFSGRLLLTRRKCGLSQVEVADTIEVSRSCLSNWERTGGDIRPHAGTLKKLSALLGVAPSYLLFGEGDSTPAMPLASPPFERALAAVQGTRWSPAEALALKALIDVGTAKA